MNWSKLTQINWKFLKVLDKCLNSGRQRIRNMDFFEFSCFSLQNSRSKALKIIRITLVIMVMAGVFWLNLWVVPTLGMFRMTLSDPPLPENGYALVFFQAGKSINAATLVSLKTGWPIVWQVWPFVVFGLLLGLYIGYPLGELARRKFAIDEASEDAIRLSEEVLTEAHEWNLSAEKTLEKALELNDRTRIMKAEISIEKREIESMKTIAEIELEAAQNWRQRVISLQKELANAKAKIRRITGKTGRKKRKMIDDLYISD